MRDPRCWREVLIRGGITAILAAVTYVFLDAAPWVWWIPVAVTALVLAKWAVRPSDLDEDEATMPE